jgi:hypothetical protein
VLGAATLTYNNNGNITTDDIGHGKVLLHWARYELDAPHQERFGGWPCQLNHEGKKVPWPFVLCIDRGHVGHRAGTCRTD